jgi:hypothetical protein
LELVLALELVLELAQELAQEQALGIIPSYMLSHIEVFVLLVNHRPIHYYYLY